MSRDARIDAYIANAQPFARPILEHVRARVHVVLPNAQETLKWSMPTYTVDGKILLVTAAFKAHAALNFWRGQELAGGQANADAMGQFGKIAALADLPSDAELDRLIGEAAALAKSALVARQVKHAPKPVPQMHPDFAAALDRSPKAKAAFDAFAPSHRREYLEWIAEAKRDATRATRIATTIDWLSEGKSRNWKYQNC
ncbi:MAG: YdeI/OmpD-associated family protein [Sphingomicrobium sp.]